MNHFYQKIITGSTYYKSKFYLPIVLLLLSVSVRAGTFNVTVTTDGNATNQLRGAIAAAETAGGSNTINIAAGTYTLNSMIAFANKGNQTFTFVGAGDGTTIISMTAGAGKDRIFNINYNILPNVSISFTGITFTNGNLTTDDGAGGGAIDCGGPSNTMTIHNCVFSNNKVTLAGTQSGPIGGGAIQCWGGTLSIDSSTFSGNSGSQLLGGAIHYNLVNSTSASGAITITKTVFKNNAVTGSTSAKGGAIYIVANTQTAAGSFTFSTSITGSTFTGNSSSGYGGAVAVDNNFSSGNTSPVNVNYNRFVSNTAANTATSAFAMGANIGNVDASNNWWGCNSGPTGCADQGALVGSGPTFTSTPFLKLTVTPNSTSSLCPAGTSTITASFLLNSTPAAVLASNLTAMVGVPVSYTPTLGSLSAQQTTIQAAGTATATYTAGNTAGTGSVTVGVDNASIATSTITINPGTAIGTQPGTSTVCLGAAATLSVAATGNGTLTYQWSKGGSPLANGTNANGSIISGVTSNTLTIANTSLTSAAANYTVSVTGGCGMLGSGNGTVNITSPTLITSGNASGTSNISSTNFAVNSGSCAAICSVTPSGGATQVSGNVTGTVTVDATVQTAPGGHVYVQRHYDIVPATSASTATATITLYYLQSDFNAYNAVPNHGADLPTGPTDPGGNKTNIRISQYHGTATTSPPKAGSYTGTGIDIDPADNNIVWNSTLGRWEVTFDVAGFSGFYLANQNTALPLTLLSFTGTAQASNAMLQWTTTDEVNTDYFEILSSTNGVDFSGIAKLPTTGNEQNGLNNYQYKSAMGAFPVYYYQLKMVDKDGQFTTSNIVAINNPAVNSGGYVVQATPNPFQSQVSIKILAPQGGQLTLELVDLNGKKLIQQSKTINQGNNTVNMEQLGNLTDGTYLLHLYNNSINQTIKLIKIK